MRRVLQRIVTRHTFASGAMLVGYCAPRGLLKYWESELKLARNNALADQADIVAISKTDPVKSAQAAAVRINTELKQEGNPTLSGDALWNAVDRDVIKSRISNIEQEAATLKKIAADAKANATCFVAGTLIHTKEGLLPIEQIKVGDYVLSKPEHGAGEVSYKRVVNTFEFEDKEVYYVSYYGEDAGSGFLIVTGNHPFWVVNEGDYSFAPEGSATPVNAWVHADHLSYEGGMSLLLHDGRKVTVDLVRKILRMAIPNMGWVDGTREMEPCHGHIVNLIGDRPVYCRGQIADVPGFMPVDGDPYGDIYFNENNDWDDPLKRRVYNIEVEDNHTYFVGDLGVWVHNTCKIKINGVRLD